MEQEHTETSTGEHLGTFVIYNMNREATNNKQIEEDYHTPSSDHAEVTDSSFETTQNSATSSDIEASDAPRNYKSLSKVYKSTEEI